MIGKFIDDPTTYSGLWTYANGDDRHALYRSSDRPAAEQCTHVTQGLAILGEETDIKQQANARRNENARSFRTVPPSGSILGIYKEIEE